MIIKFKGQVIVPKTVIILAAVSNAATQLGFPVEVWVTSGNDSIHMKGSRHYTDEALDFRTHGLTAVQVQAWKAATLLRLGKDYQVVIEDQGGPNEHMHVEHDPKPAPPAKG